MVYKDSKAYCRACDACQRTGKRMWRDELPLNPQVSLQVFAKWAIDFVGPIKPLGKNMGVWYIITVTEYLTRWAEAQLIKDCSNAIVAKFLFEYVLMRFGCPKILMSDRDTHFLNETISMILEEFQGYD